MEAMREAVACLKIGHSTSRHSYGLGRAEFIAALINNLGMLSR